MIRRGGTVAKYQGDCEDEAILRAALLRRLGFQPWAVWHARSADYTVAGMTTSHEYNIILYEGAFRVVDGPVGILLDGPRRRGGEQVPQQVRLERAARSPDGRFDGRVPPVVRRQLPGREVGRAFLEPQGLLQDELAVVSRTGVLSRRSAP
jgi:peptidoglycan hydrolase-like protein with peptidoglycan-binding domain